MLSERLASELAIEHHAVADGNLHHGAGCLGAPVCFRAGMNLEVNREVGLGHGPHSSASRANRSRWANQASGAVIRRSTSESGRACPRARDSNKQMSAPGSAGESERLLQQAADLWVAPRMEPFLHGASATGSRGSICSARGMRSRSNSVRNKGEEAALPQQTASAIQRLAAGRDRHGHACSPLPLPMPANRITTGGLIGFSCLAVASRKATKIVINRM
jgi:hypothetical protein